MNKNVWNISTIAIGGQRIKVAIRPGKPHLTPILLFNGIGASLELVIPFADQFDPDRGVITFDVPGVGGSSTPLLPYRFPGHAKMAAKVLDYFGYGFVNVFGVSWGGFLAQQFAHDYPQRCKKLILAATCSGVIGPPPSPKLGLIMASPRRYIDAEYAERVAGTIYGGEFRDDPELVKSFASKINPTSKRGYYYQLAALAGWTSLHWLRNVKQPTLVLAGNDDPLIPLTNAKLLAWCLPNSELFVVEGGHLFLLTQAYATAKRIEEFLSTYPTYESHAIPV